MAKRTVSANNNEMFEGEDTYALESQSPHLSQSPIHPNKEHVMQTHQNFGFLPSLNKNHS